MVEVSSARKLIVVSNRGPVSFARAPDGSRIARRGGGGLVTALRGLVTNHDVTWIASAMSDEDRVVAAEAGGEAIEETSRHGAPYRLRLVVPRSCCLFWLLQRGCEFALLVCAALPLGARLRTEHGA